MHDLTPRRFQQDDQPGVLNLLRAALGEGPGGERSPAFFHWKHHANPFGPSFMLVAEDEGRIVGLRAFLRWELEAGGRRVRAVRAVDTATHPEYQGRGIFTRLTKEALTELADEVDLVFNTPNQQSLPGYLKMGWRQVGRIPVSIRVRRPLRFVAGVLPVDRGGVIQEEAPPDVEADTARRALADREAVETLLARARPADGRLRTARSSRYLRWRYADAPLLDYRAVSERRRGVLRGLAIFRVRRRGRLWESTCSELLVAPGDRATAAHLLAGVIAWSPTDHITLAVPRGYGLLGCARRRWFLPTGRGLTLVANPLAGRVEPDPLRVSSWALGLGDLEVF